MAHQDVVPVEDPSVWTHPPFSGRIADGYLWGRGTLDDKQNIVGQLAAVEHLLAAGFTPARTMYFAFGHDEEVGGHGAEAVAEHLAAQGVRLEFVLDEGGVVTLGIMKGLDAPAAMVGISEKGYVSVKLTARAEGGHSSMPPPRSALGRLSEALVAVESHPLPARWDGPTATMLDTVGPELAFGLRLVMSNRWLLGPVVESTMAAKPSTNATLRTTTAVTMAQGSPQDNVLPQVASGVVNFRIVPGDTTESVLAHVRSVVPDGIEVEVYEGSIASEPAPVSRHDGPAWDALSRSIRQTWPGTVVSPYLTVGATDARNLTGLSDRVWRFSPVAATSADLASIHGIDERISVDGVGDMVAFYVRFLTQAAG
jgi:carboxypeptidase PM20D1